MHSRLPYLFTVLLQGNPAWGIVVGAHYEYAFYQKLSDILYDRILYLLILTLNEHKLTFWLRLASVSDKISYRLRLHV